MVVEFLDAVATSITMQCPSWPVYITGNTVFYMQQKLTVYKFRVLSYFSMN